MPSSDTRWPTMRTSDLIVTQTGVDLIVYDQRSEAIHTLNDVVASVWHALDGTNTAEAVAAQTGHGVETVREAISLLSAVSLLEGEPAPTTQTGKSRRALLRKMSVAAAIPAIISVSAPTSSAAQSCPAGVPIWGYACREQDIRCCCSGQVVYNKCVKSSGQLVCLCNYGN